MVDAVSVPITADSPALAPGQEMPADAPAQSDLTPTGTAPAPAAPAVPDKFKNADGSVNVEALAKSYAELESRQGQAQAETPQADAPAPDAAPVSYGAAVDSIITSAGFTPDALNSEWQTTGTLSEATMTALEGKGIPRATLEQYIAGANASKTAATAQAAATEKVAYDAVGGQEQYSTMVNWAASNLSPDEIAAYDAAVSGDEGSVKMAVAGLKARFDAANGTTGNLVLGGGNATGPTDVFRSAEEHAAAYQKARRSHDPAQIQAVQEKALRSNY